MSSSSSFPLPSNTSLSIIGRRRRHFRGRTVSPPSLSRPSLLLSVSETHVCCCFSSSPYKHADASREEFLWLREEQRWLREEQRWIREEQRWLRERGAMLAEIQSLKLRIQALEGGIQVREGGIVLEEEGNRRIAERGSPIVLKFGEEKEVIGVLETKREEEEEEKTEDKKRKLLRKGSEGDEVRELQEALQKLGFYSGEEDMEYSSFSSGTECAVKTWQATLGAPEDGIMTAELLERLYVEEQMKIARSNIGENQKGSTSTDSLKESGNGAAVASVTEISEIRQTIVKEEGVKEVEVSQQRVFLLGENRWEEPSRLAGRGKVGGSKAKDAPTKCLTCRGEGRLMCTECDGTGEPNIEPQFLEWVDGGAKCPYCQGLGYIVCDVCEGKSMT